MSVNPYYFYLYRLLLNCISGRGLARRAHRILEQNSTHAAILSSKIGAADCMRRNKLNLDRQLSLVLAAAARKCALGHQITSISNLFL